MFYEPLTRLKRAAISFGERDFVSASTCSHARLINGAGSVVNEAVNNQQLYCIGNHKIKARVINGVDALSHQHRFRLSWVSFRLSCGKFSFARCHKDANTHRQPSSFLLLRYFFSIVESMNLSDAHNALVLFIMRRCSQHEFNKPIVTLKQSTKKKEMTQNCFFFPSAIKASRRNTQNFMLFQPKDMSKTFLNAAPPNRKKATRKSVFPRRSEKKKKKLPSKKTFMGLGGGKLQTGNKLKTASFASHQQCLRRLHKAHEEAKKKMEKVA